MPEEKFAYVAGSTTRPAGLLNGITPLSATAGGSDAAMATDLAAISNSVAGIAGTANIVVIASQREFLKIGNQLPLFPLSLYASGGLADGSLVAVAGADIKVLGFRVQ